MSASLLDVNVLIALAYEWHVNHSLVQGWFRQSAAAWATCPVTESGFVRIACNPGAIRQSVKTVEALRMLSTITVRPGYRFWPADISFAEAVQPFQERLVRSSAGDRRVSARAGDQEQRPSGYVRQRHRGAGRQGVRTIRNAVALKRTLANNAKPVSLKCNAAIKGVMVQAQVSKTTGLAKWVVTLIVFTIAMVSAATAQVPDCALGKLSDYEMLGPQGCAVGENRFSNFRYQHASGGLPSSAISVTPGTSPDSDDPGMLFEAKWVAPVTSRPSPTCSTCSPRENRSAVPPSRCNSGRLPERERPESSPKSVRCRQARTTAVRPSSSFRWYSAPVQQEKSATRGSSPVQRASFG